jgi:hypothetical protein
MMRAVVLACMATVVLAKPTWAGSATDDLAVGVNAGTLGAGLSVTKALVPGRLNAELDLNAPLQPSYSFNSGGTHYTGTLRLLGIGGLTNYFPWSNLFHLSAGLFYDDNKVSTQARPSNGTYRLDGQSFTTQQLTSLSGSIAFSRIAPYVGLGLGNTTASAGWHLNGNVGVLYQRAQVDLTATTPYATGSAPYNALFAALDAQRRLVGTDAGHLQWYPVVTLGIQYRF